MINVKDGDLINIEDQVFRVKNDSLEKVDNTFAIVNVDLDSIDLESANPKRFEKQIYFRMSVDDLPVFIERFSDLLDEQSRESSFFRDI